MVRRRSIGGGVSRGTGSLGASRIAVMKERQKPTAFELRWVVGWTLAGAILRLWRFDRLGMDHFDEGVYAQAVQWLLAPPRGGPVCDPGSIAYAPPGFTFAARCVALFLSDPAAAARAVSLFSGTLTIPAVAWFTRQIAGSRAAMAGAPIVAVAGPAVVFSRVGLTDATFLLAWIVVMAIGIWFLAKPSAAESVALGIAVGLAQWIKYNGWMSGVVVALAAVLNCLDPRTRAVGWRSIRWGILAAAVAAVVYAPWFEFVEEHGGYRALLEHHRSYVDGWRAWTSNWTSQQAQQIAIAGQLWGRLTWSSIGWAGAILGASFGLAADRRVWLAVVGFIGAGVFGLIPELGWWFGLAALPALLTSSRADHRLLGSWWLLMSAATPLYHPYARLWLPLSAAGWVMTGLVAGRLVEGPTEGALRLKPWIVVAVAGVAVHALILRDAMPLGGLLAPTDGLQRTVRQAFERMSRSTAGTIHVLGRPQILDEIAATSPDLTRSIRRLPGMDGLGQVTSPWDWLVVDDAVATGWTPEGLTGTINVQRWGIPMSAATLMDVDPEASNGQSHRITAGDAGVTAGGMPADRPCATLWIIEFGR